MHLPDSLLSKLRARREEQRAQRSETDRRAASSPSSQNFLGRVTEMFEHGDVERVAAGYVVAMETWRDEIEQHHDAFLLYPGMGPMLYLTADGRILEDLRGWEGDEVREVTGDQVFVALVVGAKNTGLEELLDLLPKPPPGAVTCPRCRGTHWSALAPGVDVFPCIECRALGWVASVAEP